MVYLERAPQPRLRPWVRTLWYCQSAALPHAQERVLPNGCIQIILNLARRYLTGSRDEQLAAELIVGARRTYEVIHTTDLAELVGIVVEPGAFVALFHERADLFFEQSIPLLDLWPRFPLSRLLQVPAAAKLSVLEQLLCESLHGYRPPCPMLTGALAFLNRPDVTVRDCAAAAGISERRLSQLFREHAGLSPKLWSRIRRFQTAIKALHRGTEVPWAELALHCGYYDQAHFINDFRSFSGINPVTYTRQLGPWRNHVPID